MWEESPVGDWTLEIKNDGRQRVDLTNWSISFYGTKEHPGPGAPSPDTIGTNPIVNSNTPDIAPAATEVDLNQVPEDPVSQKKLKKSRRQKTCENQIKQFHEFFFDQIPFFAISNMIKRDKYSQVHGYLTFSTLWRPLHCVLP